MQIYVLYNELKCPFSVVRRLSCVRQASKSRQLPPASEGPRRLGV